MITFYDRLKDHHAKAGYTRGQFEGDAPAGKRGMTHFRIVKVSDTCMAVRMYSTNIITAHSDGRVVINCGGWAGSGTTNQRLSEALREYSPTYGPRYLKSVMFRGLSQRTFGVYKYYDGMEFDREWNLLSPPKPFRQRRINEEESRKFYRAIKESGFRGVFPVIHATLDRSQASGCIPIPRELRGIVQSPDRAEIWPEVVRAFAGTKWSPRTREQAWTALMAHCKEPMYETTDSEVYHHRK